MKNFLFRGTFFLLVLSASLCKAQTAKKFNLESLFKENKLITYPKQTVTIVKEGAYNAVSLKGIVWLKGVTFSTGSIDIDLRGRDVLQQSFLGIAFHGLDTVTYDAIYFRHSIFTLLTL